MKLSLVYLDKNNCNLVREDNSPETKYPRLLRGLIPQFGKLKPGTRIVSHQFAIPGIPPQESVVMKSKETGEQHRIYLWTAPIRVDSEALDKVPQ